MVAKAAIKAIKSGVQVIKSTIKSTIKAGVNKIKKKETANKGTQTRSLIPNLEHAASLVEYEIGLVGFDGTLSHNDELHLAGLFAESIGLEAPNYWG